MTHFLMVFDRAHGRLLRQDPFTDSREALEARFQAELDHVKDPDVEVVVLTGDSLASVQHTHGRYFYSVAELTSENRRASTPDVTAVVY